MTIVDHRVLVNAPPEVAWQLLGDLEALPKWHVNCTATSMLTTQHEGVGVRRRNTMRGRPDVVEEIVSWYPNLGFEYIVVDGPRYRSNRGRIRLQPIPEGTVIQWTFEYQLGGFLAGLRDVFHRRRLDDEMARNLKRFKQLVESSGVRMDAATIERVAMRAAPSAAERAAIGEATTRIRQQRVEAPEDQQPAPLEPTLSRLPPALPETPPQPIQAVQVPPETASAEMPPIAEPPLSDEDTRPRPAVSASSLATPEAPEPVADLFDLEELPAQSESELAPAQEQAAEPPVLAAEDEALLEVDDHEADTITEAPTEPVREKEESPHDATAESAIAAIEPEATPLGGPVTEESAAIEAGPAVPEVETVEPLSEPAPTPPSVPQVSAEPEASPVEPAQPRATAPDASILDREIAPVGPSIWEVFGIAPPDEAESPPAAPVGSAPQPAKEVASSPATERRSPRRRHAIRFRVFQRAQGLRLRLNREQAQRLQHRIKKASP